MPAKQFSDPVDRVFRLDRKTYDMARALGINISEAARAGVESAIGKEIQRSDRVDPSIAGAYIDALKERADRDRSVLECVTAAFLAQANNDQAMLDQTDRIAAALVTLPASYRYPGFLYKRLPEVSGLIYLDMWDEIRGYVTAQLNEEVDLPQIYSVVKNKGKEGVF